MLLSMKNATFNRSSLSLALLLAPALTASAVTFTNDTLIGLSDTNYDGQELIVSKRQAHAVRDMLRW